MKKYIIMIACILSAIGCREKSEGYTVYRIPANGHYCNGWRTEPSEPSTTIEAQFTASCLYDEGLLTAGWNKLWGITSNPITQGIHKYSIRVGWRCINNRFVLAAYYYIDGKRGETIMDTVAVGEPFTAHIGWIDDCYMVTINEHSVEIETDERAGPLFRCYPYFGGQSTAPHTMDILIREI